MPVSSKSSRSAVSRSVSPALWLPVTDCQNPGETLRDTAVRELYEETGIDASRHDLVDWGKQNVYEIYPHWRHRYAPGVTHNTEHVFGLEVPELTEITLAPREHVAYAWLPWRDAADKAFSWSNAEAIRELPQRIAAARGAAPGT